MNDRTNDTASQSAGLNRSDLRADCGNCFGLCCVALAFAASADFAVDKEAGRPCSNLQTDFRCGVHDSLRQRGFRGCTVYDCFGAGQKVSQIAFKGRDWRQAPESARLMFAALPVMEQLHEMLWYLSEALTRQAAGPLHAELASALDETERLTRQEPGALLELDIPAHRARIGPLLQRVSELVRDEALSRARNLPKRRKAYGRGADLAGAKLCGADLRGVSLRGACLIAADLRGADLRAAELIGADLRDADLSGADLTGCLFLTQLQLNGAKGDAGTRLSAPLARPAHWSMAESLGRNG